jgi:hypothetical protein
MGAGRVPALKGQKGAQATKAPRQKKARLESRAENWRFPFDGKLSSRNTNGIGFSLGIYVQISQ